VIALAAVAFIVGIVVGAGANSDGHASRATSFVNNWAAQRYDAMYSGVDAATRQALTPATFAATYRSAWDTATATRLRVTGHAHETGSGSVVVPVAVQTRLFGVLHGMMTFPFVHDSAGTGIAWSRDLVFPGLRPGERLHSALALPPRASLLARDGSVLASGPASTDGGQRLSPLGNTVTSIVGTTGPIPASRRAALIAQGVPADADVGQSGLEQIFDAQLRGTAGGGLMAGARTLATAAPVAGQAVRTSISPTIQTAAVTALGGQLGGVVVLRPSDGEILGVAGLGIDDLQPPGSTFKMITVSGALTYGIATPSTVFPYATQALLDGVPLTNAGMEDCGGTLTLAFAVSCNSVFAPLGAKLGAAHLVATAEKFGFNQPTGIPGAVTSTIPQASQIQGDLAVGSSAIGQDMVLASPLQMAIVASTIGEGGMRPRPTFMKGQRLPRVRAISAHVARDVRRMMIDVVREGTGTNAAISGVTVAGKTGTAELVNTNAPGASTPQNTDAWFAAFAPALSPHVAVGVMLVRDGAGGDTAAPVARQVLETALSNGF
jgi:cell division protein FtsI/penicillin-binding protein 2